MSETFITISAAVVAALLMAAGVAVYKAGRQQAAEDEGRHLRERGAKHEAQLQTRHRGRRTRGYI